MQISLLSKISQVIGTVHLLFQTTKLGLELGYPLMAFNMNSCDIGDVTHSIMLKLAQDFDRTHKTSTQYYLAPLEVNELILIKYAHKTPENQQSQLIVPQNIELINKIYYELNRTTLTQKEIITALNMYFGTTKVYCEFQNRINKTKYQTSLTEILGL